MTIGMILPPGVGFAMVEERRATKGPHLCYVGEKHKQSVNPGAGHSECRANEPEGQMAEDQLGMAGTRRLRRR